MKSFIDEFLYDSQTLQHCGVNSQSLVVVKKHIVLIDALFINSFVCYASFNDSVLELKNEISVVEGTAIDKQRLYFNGTQLENNKTLCSYGIVHYSVVYLEREITSYHTNKNFDTYTAKQSDTANGIDIKEHILKREGISK